MLAQLSPEVADRPAVRTDVRPAVRPVVRPDVPREAHPEVRAEPTAETPRPRRAGRRLPHPPGRRGHLWLAALVIGGILAAVPGLTSPGPTRIAASAVDFGLGQGANDVDISGTIEDASVRQGITEAEAHARLQELAASRASREPKTVLPTQGYESTCFCMRWGTFHYGIDLAAPLGTPIYAAVDGVVLRAGPATGFGNAVYIQDADGNVEVYGHMRYFFVKPGQIVHAGDYIAKVGSEGQSTGPHLHFQINRGTEYGKPMDPAPWFAARGITLPQG